MQALTGTFNGYWECIDHSGGGYGCSAPGVHPVQWYYDQAVSARTAACGSNQECLDGRHDRIYPRSAEFDYTFLPAVSPAAKVERWHQQAAAFQAFAATVPAADQAWILKGLREEQVSLEARLDALSQSLVDKKDAVLNVAFKQRLLDEAELVRGPVVVELATARGTAVEVNAILAAYQAALAPLSVRMTALATAYQEYRELEAADLGTIAGFAISAGGAMSYVELASLKVSVAELARDSSERAGDILLEAMRLSAELVEVQESYSTKLALHQDFFDEYQVVKPHLSDEAAVAASRMAEYVRRSQRRLHGEIVDLIAQLNRRTQMLVLTSVQAETREAVAQTEGARASARFLDTTTAMIADAWQEPAKSSVLKLPYLSAQYGAMTRLLETEPVCLGAQPDYAHEGCLILGTNYPKVRLHFADSLPLRLKRDANKLAANGVDQVLVAALKQAILVGDLALAVELHDQAVTKSEGQP